MKILMLVNTENHDEQGRHYPGEVADIPDEIAVKWLNEGWALPHKEQEVETAVSDSPEQATGKRQR